MAPDIMEAVLPLSDRILQWRDSDNIWRSLVSREDEADTEFQPRTGAVGVLIQADGEVWRRPSWLVAGGELRQSRQVEVLRTDGQALRADRRRTGLGLRMDRPRLADHRPVRRRVPQTVRIDRPDYL